jgi:hypothetical protein
VHGRGSEFNERGRESMRKLVSASAFAREVNAFAREIKCTHKERIAFARKANALVDETSTCALHISKRCECKGRKRTCDW